MDQPSSQPNQGPSLQPEMAPNLQQVPETDAPEAPDRQPAGAERAPRPETKQPGQGMSLPPVQIPVIAADDDDDNQQTDDNPPKVVITTPMIAEDVDVIEMEWVNKAKKIIKETKSDPFAQEEAMEQLQIEYLRKRYGKEIKKTRGS